MVGAIPRLSGSVNGQVLHRLADCVIEQNFPASFSDELRKCARQLGRQNVELPSDLQEKLTSCARGTGNDSEFTELGKSLRALIEDQAVLAG